MGNRIKEEEKIERVIRSLSKLPENRRCINCNSLGPQYVCTTFWTFVCTNCSGIQREFNHRVKSVSMAKFTAEEVTALQAGGNERAKQIYFKDWDPRRHSYPDSNNVQRLRDFIKHVYVDRKFTGERAQNNLSRVRLNDKDESHESRKICFLQSPRYEDRNDPRSPSLRNEDSSVKFYYDERRSPRYASRNGNQRRNPIKIEVVDDRFRDNESRSRRFSSTESKVTAVPPDGQMNADSGKKLASASGQKSVKENPAEQRNNNPETQIIIVSSQLSDAADAPDAQPTSQSNGSDWAPFENSTAEEAPQTPNRNNLKASTTETIPKTTDTLEFLLSELSGPLYATASGIYEVHSADIDPSSATVENLSAGGDLPPTSTGQITAYPNNVGASSVTSTTNTELTQPSAACGSTTQSMSPPARAVPLNNQPTVAPNAQNLSSTFAELCLQDTSNPAQDTRSEVKTQPSTIETKSIGRKELPADLFTTSYLSGPAPQASWQNVQPHNMGYGLQYYANAAPVSAFPSAANYTNPFDVTEGKTQVHASQFPTMATLQGAQPAMSTGAGLVRTLSIGALGSMVPQSPNYASLMPPQPPFSPGFAAGAYFEQINNNMQPPRPRRAGSFNSDRTIQQSAGGYMATSGTPNSFPKRGGNPFG